MSHKLRIILKEQIVENKTPAAKQLRNDKTQFHVNKYSYPPHFSKDEGDMVTYCQNFANENHKIWGLGLKSSSANWWWKL